MDKVKVTVMHLFNYLTIVEEMTFRLAIVHHWDEFYVKAQFVGKKTLEDYII